MVQERCSRAPSPKGKVAVQRSYRAGMGMGSGDRHLIALPVLGRLGKRELQSHGIRIELYAVQAQPVVGAVRGIFPNSQQAVIGQRDGAPIHGCVIPAASGLQVGGDNTELVEGNAIPGLAPADGTFQA